MLNHKQNVEGVQEFQKAEEHSNKKWLLFAAFAFSALLAVALMSGCSSSGSSSSESGSTNTEEQVDYNNLAMGTTIELKDGVKVCVNSVQTGLTKYDGSEVSCVSVSYENGSDSEVSYNAMSDWKAQDADGVQKGYTYYNDGENELNSGRLAAGGTVTGNIYFEGNPVKVLYYEKGYGDSTAAWVVS